MRRTGLLGLLVISILTAAIPVQAATEIPTLPAAEAALESEEAADDHAEDAVSSEAVSESEAETLIQETDAEVQTPKDDETAVFADPASIDASAQDSGSELIGDSDLEESTGSVENPEQEENVELAEDTEHEDSSALNEDTSLTETSAPESADEAVSAEQDFASSEQSSYAAVAENAMLSASSGVATDIAEEMTRDRIHFITLNGSYCNSDAILIESNGKYGLIDSSNPSTPSDDPNLAFTREYIDAAANGKTVVKYLTDLDVSHLEFVLATHSHSDHNGGIPDIAASGLVDNKTVYIYKEYAAITGQEAYHNDYYLEIATEAMKAKEATLLNVLDPNLEAKARQALGAALKRDTTDEVGDHLEFSFGDFLLRLFNLHVSSTVNENQNSIVTTVKKDDSGAILMADIELENYMESRTVDAILRNDPTFRTDVYKVGHHGFSTSNSYDTLNALKPANAVVTTTYRSAAPFSTTLYNYFVEAFGGTVFRTSDNGPAIIAEFGDQAVSIRRPTAKDAFTKAIPWITVYPNGWRQWYPDEETINLHFYEPQWIYFKSGSPVKGWFKIGSDWYFAKDNYAVGPGWVTSGSKRYHLDSHGKMQTNCWVSSDGKWYHLDSNGVMQTNCWVSSGGKWYLMDSDGAMLKGWQTVGSKTYFFTDSGAMHTGWLKDNGNWYFFASNGAMQTGWVSSGGKWYLMDSDGAMLKGWRTVGSKTYFLGDDGVMRTGWVKYDGNWYFLNSSGVMQTGWVSSGGKWYLMGDDGAMLMGWQTVGSKTYFLNDGGTMYTGWLKDNGNWYFFGSGGAMQTGWVNTGGKWYLMDSNGAMLMGWQIVDGKTYYLDNGGVRQTGWIKDDGKWYYLESDGVMAADKWIGDYYMKSNGEMAVNEWIGRYYVGADGKWIRNYQAA